jgi:hypothetical protein
VGPGAGLEALEKCLSPLSGIDLDFLVIQPHDLGTVPNELFRLPEKEIYTKVKTIHFLS